MIKRVIQVISIIISLCLFVVACSSPFAETQPAPVPCLAIDSNIPSYHVIPSQGIPAQAGSRIIINWTLYKPGPNIQSSTTPVDKIQRAVMREMLYGPFPSRNAVDHLAGQNTNAASRGQVIVSSQPIITSGCNNQSFTSSIIFPKQLKSGYYDLYIEGSSSFASGTSTIGSEVPIHIKAG